MGQKAKPKVLRINISDSWDSNWYGTQYTYKQNLLEDYKIRNFITDELRTAGTSSIIISRKSNTTLVVVYVSRPGVIFGKNGIDIKAVTEEIKNKIDSKIKIEIREIKNPDLDPKVLADFIAGQLVKRVPFRRAMKLGLQKATKAGALGVRIACSGRLGGVEIARKEELKQGSVPLQTFRANIRFAISEASTIYGTCGVKVWVNNGEVANFQNNINS